MACTQVIENDLVDSTTFERWVRLQTDALNVIANSPIITDEDSDKAYLIVDDVNAHYECVKEKNNSVTNVTTDVATLQSRFQELKDAIDERKGDIAVAKDRAILTRSPELSRSYYDGLFPINRPFRHYTIPLLIALSLFLGTMSFFYFMSILGIHANFIFHLPNTYGPSTNSNRPFLIMTFIAVILLALTIYGFTK